MIMLVQQIINGVGLGCLYGLIAIGYTMIFGVLRMVNFAHSQLFMLGPIFIYFALGALGLTVGWFGQMIPLTGPQTGLTLALALLGAAVFCALIGLAVERVIYRQLTRERGRMLMLSSMGAAIVLENAIMLFAGSNVKPFPPIIPQTYFVLGGLRFASTQIFMLIVFACLMAGLSYIVNRTYLGISMRGVAEDYEMASLAGIDPIRVIMWVFIIGPALGGISGMLFSMHYGQVYYYMGSQIGNKGWVAAVLGGIGDIKGTAIAGVILGVLECLAAGYLPILSHGVLGSEYKDVIAFILLILVLLFRPQGLFGKSVEAA